MNCIVRDMTNGFSCVFCASVIDVKILKRAWIDTRKRKKGQQEICITKCWTTLTHTLLGTWDELKHITNLQKDEWRSVIIHSYWKLRGSLRVDAWQSRIWVLRRQLYNAIEGNQFILVLLLCFCSDSKFAWDNSSQWLVVFTYVRLTLSCGTQL